MKDIEANKELIAACGFYCGACRKYLSFFSDQTVRLASAISVSMANKLSLRK